jgi:histidinol-phosphate aminotransferase
MGSHHPGADIVAALDALPQGALLVLDEAYVDLAPPGTAAPVAADDPRVIRMRTFSKGYGMAGARVGYALGAPDLIRAFDKVRNHFGMGRVAQAGALAALADQDHLAGVRAAVEQARAAFGAVARDNGLVPLPSATNFLTIDCGRDGDFARAVLRGLIARDVFVRMPFVAPHDRCIRVSLGPDAALAVFAEALPGALAEARG